MTMPSPTVPAALIAMQVYPPVEPAQGANTSPLTQVALAYVARRINLYLRFGDPLRIIQRDHWRRVALFPPMAMFCRVRWQAGLDGQIARELLVMQARMPLGHRLHTPGVFPGAQVLLRADGIVAVRSVLRKIDAIEALGIAPGEVSPVYWRTLDRCLASGEVLPSYTMEQPAIRRHTGDKR